MVDWKKEILSKRMDIPLLPTWAIFTQRSSFSLQLDAELHRRGFGDAIPQGPELASLARPNINPFTHKLCAAGSPALLIQFHRNPPFSFSGWLSWGSSAEPSLLPQQSLCLHFCCSVGSHHKKVCLNIHLQFRLRTTNHPPAPPTVSGIQCTVFVA